MEALWLFLLGFATAAYGVMVGAGGGFVLSPMLVFIGLEPATAAGTSLALVTVTGISGTHVYRKSGLIDLRSGVLFAAAAIPGSVIAPFVVSNLGGNIFKILFGVLLIGLAVLMLVRPNPGEGAGEGGNDAEADDRRGSRRIVARDGRVFRYRFSEPAAVAFNLVLGFVSSFFGIAGGPIRTPVLAHFFNIPVRVAVATSIFALAFYGAAGAVVYGALGHLDLSTFLWAGIGFVAGSQVGARLAGRVGGSWILSLLLVVVFALGAMLLFQGVRG